MIKSICDITGSTPAAPLQITYDGKLKLQLDVCSSEADRIIKEIQDQVKTIDVKAVMGKVVADVEPA